MYKIITGMSKEYYYLIGKDMIDAWLKFWPEELILHIYTEDDLKIDNTRIQIIQLDSMDDEYHKFQNQELSKFDLRTKTFAKKAWPIMKNLEENTGKLVWIDADVIVFDYITTEWLDSLIGDDDFSSHIGVFQSSFYSVETGFFIINRENKFKNTFLKKYKKIYYNRNFSDMFKPFDGDVFGKVIRDMKDNTNFKYKELNNNFGKLSPFNKIFEGKMSHYKAKRKKAYEESKQFKIS